MKILIASDAYRGYPSGVWTGDQQLYKILDQRGHQLFFFDTLDAKHIRDFTHTVGFMGLPSKKRFAKHFEVIKPDAVHIVSEGMVGLSCRNFCVHNNIPFTTAYHTHLDIIINGITKIPKSWLQKYLTWFHRPAKKIHVYTNTLAKILRERGLTQEIVIYPPGIDHSVYRYNPKAHSLQKYKRPFFMTMSRINKEKNIEAFLELDLPGTKFVIGSGPHKNKLMKKYGQRAVFLEYDHPTDLLSQGDVFVCPSKFETFGLVMVEAMACGLPIAGFPVMGPIDIINPGVTGFVDNDLKKAALACLDLKKDECIQAAKAYSWERTVTELFDHLVPI